MFGAIKRYAQKKNQAEFTKRFKEVYKMPPQEWLQQCSDRAWHSPDVLQLEQKERWNLFVYDNLMIGRNEYPLLRDRGTFRWHGFTRNHYSMWKANLEKGSYAVPLVPKDPRDITPWSETDRFANRFGHHSAIKGQLFSVPPSVLLELDKTRQNNVEFIRQRVEIEVPLKEVLFFGDQGVEPVKRTINIQQAWMYVGKSEFWNDQIDAGWMFSPVDIHKARSISTTGHDETRHYYYFNS